VAQLLAFLAVAAAIICTPGQDTALTIRNVLSGGRRSGVATALGVALGQAVWTLATAIGVAAAIAASQSVYTVIKVAGAVYLIFLGIQSLWHAFRSGSGFHVAPRGGVTPRRGLRQGVVSNLANPKMAAFFTSLLPQFASSFVGLLALGLLFCSLTFLWLTTYSIVLEKAQSVVLRPRVRRAFEAAMGAVLVALGLRLATSPRS
jgi:threonine/homoserine/homoserine lactone efflux protein